MANYDIFCKIMASVKGLVFIILEIYIDQNADSRKRRAAMNRRTMYVTGRKPRTLLVIILAMAACLMQVVLAVATEPESGGSSAPYSTIDFNSVAYNPIWYDDESGGWGARLDEIIVQNTKFTYDHGFPSNPDPVSGGGMIWFLPNFGDANGDGEGTRGMYLTAYSSQVETLTIENAGAGTFKLAGFDLTVFNIDEDGLASATGYRNGDITGTQTINAMESGHIALGGDFENVDKVVLSSTSGGFHVVFDNFAFQAPILTAPSVTTASVTAYSSASADMGGAVIENSGVSVTERGVVYSTTDNTPEIGETGVVKNSNGDGEGSFSGTVGGLEAGVTYYVRAYAVYGSDTEYGTMVSFTTPAVTVSKTGTVTFDGKQEGYTSADTEAIKKTVTLTKQGSGAVTGLVAALSGGADTHFLLGTVDPDALGESGSSTYFYIRPKTGLAAGTYTETMTVTSDGGISHSFDVSFTVTAAPATFTISETGTVTFDGKQIGYTAADADAIKKTVTITKQGSGAVTGLAAALSCGEVTNFLLGTVDPDALGESVSSTYFYIRPKTGLAAGTYTETVIVTADGGISHNFDVSFTVTAAPATFTVSETGTVTFEGKQAGYTSADTDAIKKTVTITKQGSGVVTSLAAALSCGEVTNFLLGTVDPDALGESVSSTYFYIRPKTGLAAGTYTETVTITANGGISHSFSVSFTVTAAPTQIIALSPEGAYAFPEAAAGYPAQSALSVTVTSTGSGATGPLSVTLSGANTSAFELSKTSVASIAPEDSDSFAIVPKTGLAAGDYTATATVSGGLGIEPQSLKVSFKVNYVMNEDALQEQIDTTTIIIVEGLFAKEARLIVVPIADGDEDRAQLEEQLSEQSAIAAYEVHVEPADAFRPPLTLSFQVGETYNGRTVYILHQLADGSTDVYTPTVANGSAVITVDELSPFLLAVDPQVTIKTQPQSVLALVNQTASFHVSAGGLEPLSYRWQRRTGANATWEDIADAAGPEYTTTTLNKSHDGYQYRVIVSDVLGNIATSDAAVLTVTESPGTGDDSQPFVYVVMAVLFAAVIINILCKRRSA